MTIRVKKVSEDRYMAKLMLPDMAAVKAEWSTTDPLSSHDLVNELLARGCHQIDIADAIAEQDPDWIEKSPERDKPTWPCIPAS
jgi:hypothetical protein